ncbi:hypothetical protein LOCC1_G008445 [Lachnellula occidentalis]|uniref:Cupin type-2 domain-containing protein n=1 Tax=Lachnellula occidentalis TaxID=215460 RepID=A0A8H8U6R1_9HELO|nr:hypothetical protein LOCC1_G008445 [Lachnellula occidentalis]
MPPSPTITHTPSTSGETLHLGPVTIRIIEDGSHTNNRIGAVMLSIAPHTPGPALHWHRMHDETFLITRGRFVFTTDKTTQTASTHDYIVVPPGALHTFANPFPEPAEFYNSFTPAYYVDYLRLLASETGKAGGELSEERAEEVMAQFATFVHEAEVEGGMDG